MTRQLNYPGRCTGLEGQIVGPTLLGQLLVITATFYDAARNVTEAFTRPATVDEIDAQRATVTACGFHGLTKDLPPLRTTGGRTRVRPHCTTGRNERPMTTTIPASVEVRRQAVLDAAKQLLFSESFGPSLPTVAASLLPFGIDIVYNPLHMMAVSALSDCLRYGLEPSPSALTILGAAA